MKQMYVYIMANERPTLYTGVTDNLLVRVDQHKRELIEGFTKKNTIYTNLSTMKFLQDKYSQSLEKNK